MTLAGAASAANTDRSAQMMREANVPPAVLADRIERECVRGGAVDGSCKPSGANTTVDGFVAAINANPQGKRWVASAQELPKFLRALKRGPFIGQLCLSGVHPDGQVAAYCRAERGAHPGEGAWWMGEHLVLAEDCLNSVVTYRPTPLPPVTVTGTRWLPRSLGQYTDPYATETDENSCPLKGSRLTGIHVFAQEALNTPCAQRYVINPANYTEGSGRVGGWVHTGDEEVFSRRCGAEMHQAAAAGQIPWARSAHRVQLVNVTPTGEKVLIFEGTVRGGNILDPADENSALLLTGDHKFVDVPKEIQTGSLVWFFPEGGMASPTETGVGMDADRLVPSEGCQPRVKIASAIEGSLPPTRRDSGYAYGD